MAARLTLQERQLRAITERAWQTQVERIATLAGWDFFHAPDNRPITARSGAKYVQDVRGGWPDLVLVKRGRQVVLELKKQAGYEWKPGQVKWLLLLQECGAEVAMVRPGDVDLVTAWLVHGVRLPVFTAPAVPGQRVAGC